MHIFWRKKGFNDEIVGVCKCMETRQTTRPQLIKFWFDITYGLNKQLCSIINSYITYPVITTKYIIVLFICLSPKLLCSVLFHRYLDGYLRVDINILVADRDTQNLVNNSLYDQIKLNQIRLCWSVWILLWLSISDLSFENHRCISFPFSKLK